MSKSQKQAMFITHWLYDDLRRTCVGIVGVIKQNVPGTDRRWVLRKFSQDPIESLFGSIRSLSGSNVTMNGRKFDYVTKYAVLTETARRAVCFSCMTARLAVFGFMTFITHPVGELWIITLLHMGVVNKNSNDISGIVSPCT